MILKVSLKSIYKTLALLTNYLLSMIKQGVFATYF